MNKWVCRRVRAGSKVIAALFKKTSKVECKQESDYINLIIIFFDRSEIFKSVYWKSISYFFSCNARCLNTGESPR